MLFVLRCVITFYTLMAAIVRTGSEFIYQDFATFGQEHFYGQNANNIQIFGNFYCQDICPF